MSTQQDHEQWDIVTSVGFTALLVAAGRAVDSCREDRLVDDPWAERFVEAARPRSTVPVHPDQSWAVADPAVQPEVDAFWSMMTSYQGVRSRFFDTMLDAAVAQGVDQVVLLAAGLDARSLRLEWGPPVTVFEIDQAGVMAFKDEVVAAHDGRVTCDRRVVGVDLRDDWAAALRDAGFDPSKPTVWLAEGLLPFLPAAAEEQLLRTIDELSAPGSHVAAEHFEDAFRMLGAQRSMAALAEPFGISVPDLASSEPRTHAAERLTAYGWEVAVRPSPDVARGYGRELGAMPDGTPFRSELITARKN